MSKHILLAEDDSDDQLFFTAALEEVSLTARLSIVSGSDAALKFLNKARNLPDICVFDINMPGTSGIELLQIVRGDDVLKKIPVIMLSTTSEPETKKRCLELGAAAFYIKPGSHKILKDIVRKIIAH